MKHNKSKNKVLSLQELANVEGGAKLEPGEGLQPQQWSTASGGGSCYPQVPGGEWSTASWGCV